MKYSTHKQLGIIFYQYCRNQNQKAAPVCVQQQVNVWHKIHAL